MDYSLSMNLVLEIMDKVRLNPYSNGLLSES